RIGKIELAHGGTLFLDEISELSPDLQVKLLRVLEQRVITRVGGNDEIPVDFRLIAATNRDLEKEVREGRFRQDLYFRLKVVTVELPPLRERPEDIPLLVQHFVNQFNAQLGRSVKRLAPSLVDALRAYPWPGNVRELKNVVENMVLFARGEELTLEDLPAEIRQARPAALQEAVPSRWVPRRMEDIEKEAILKTLEFTQGHRARAAELLGIGLRTLQRKLKEYNLKVPPGGRS
ncbi:MAG: sigma 54-interacting transcriptional regulator, partial [Thermoanaerobaculum sp.]